MNKLIEQRCKPCEGGINPLSTLAAEKLLGQLHSDWHLAEDTSAIERTFNFKNFYHTMSFVNALAHIANQEDHHPDLQVGYNRCVVRYQTHAIGGLSENDFICAAKADLLLTA